MNHLGDTNKMVGEDHIRDATKMVSDTPRTDAAYFKPGATMYDLAGEMKRLERELNAANVEIEEKRKDVVWLATEKAKLENCVTELENRLRALWDKYDGDRKHYMARIQRLEEAGNGLLWYFCPKNTGDISFLQSEAIRMWNKAKEDKL